ncbi:MAG: hypothetical protein B7Z63_05145 [Ignavibacteriae bacterium 37-53-5]|nr:MAG: hypothetical protein B7Z63_05145 [Ignavibacteriae bacterium 37-53-5]
MPLSDSETEKQPTISVVTATWNAAQHLPGLITSLQGQTDKEFEWVVADGASDDGTLELLRSVTGLNIVISSQQDFGIYDALNRAIRIASGDYYIVCGAGRVGEYIQEELEATGRALVLVEKNLAHLSERFKGSSTVLMLEGDPTSDEVLQEAGILRAKGLFAALGTDKDNLFVVLSARGLNPQLRIVARADDEETRPKLMRAGADAVIVVNDRVSAIHR